MIVEFVGPGGVGKTTVEPLVAELLGIVYYAGKKRHAIDGTPLSSPQVLARRLSSIVTHPRLAARSLRAHPGSVIDRARFAVDLARRCQTAELAAGAGDGVVASGPLHGLIMMSSASGAEVGSFQRLVPLADVYVSLHADSGVIRERLAQRWEEAGFELEAGADWVERYEKAAEVALAQVPRPSISVDASSSPGVVAAEVADGIRPFLAGDTGSKSEETK